METKRITLTTLLLLSVCSTNAEIYKWTDSSGKVIFSDTPPPNQKIEQIELKINTYTAVEIRPLTERLEKKDKVVMYSTTWCGSCKRAKRYFKKNNIPYVSYDVEHNRIGKMDFKLLKAKSVPVIIVGSKRMNGFTPARFDKLYRKEILDKKIKKNLGPVDENAR